MTLSDNWVVQNLQNSLETWNSKLAEIWNLVTQTPEMNRCRPSLPIRHS